jgi:hypothetical protein
LTPAQTGRPVGYNSTANLESGLWITLDPIGFPILAAARAGNILTGFVVAFRLVCF